VDYALVGFGQQDTARAIRPVGSGNLPAGYCRSAAVAGTWPVAGRSGRGRATRHGRSVGIGERERRERTIGSMGIGSIGPVAFFCNNL
jgi:hypothetical protein